MFLTRLIYVSEVNSELTDKDIQQILSSARKNNEKQQVTGVLCFNRNLFLQCLEGGRNEVNDIYHKISGDSRHSNLELLDYKQIDSRAFSKWAMGYMPESSITHDLNLKYSGSNHFSPYEMSGESCHNLLMELIKTVPVI